ncbi:MAG TPA: GNAT family N-acetyltransferase [Jatrophihabitantaceae bacterium]|jgi:ribosomal protein S18 acetylase RimI-like enzyme
MTVTLRAMSDDELAPLVERWQQRFASKIAPARGLSPDEATVQARKDFADLLPHGVRTDDQLLFVAEADGEPVGALWLSTRSPDGAAAAWIHEIEVEESQRGKGYGRAIMLLAEQECRQRGIDAIRLNVFGPNTTARTLYESLGYQVLFQKMGKGLTTE